MGTGVLSVAEINKLATIPSMDELRAKIIGLLPGSGCPVGTRYQSLQRERSRLVLLFTPGLSVAFCLCAVCAGIKSTMHGLVRKR